MQGPKTPYPPDQGEPGAAPDHPGPPLLREKSGQDRILYGWLCIFLDRRTKSRLMECYCCMNSFRTEVTPENRTPTKDVLNDEQILERRNGITN